MEEVAGSIPAGSTLVMSRVIVPDLGGLLGLVIAAGVDG